MAKSVKPSSNSSNTNKKKTIPKSSTADKAKDTKQNKTIEKKPVSATAVAPKAKVQPSASVFAKKPMETKAKSTVAKSLSKEKVETKTNTPIASKKVSPVATVQPQVKKKKFPANVVFGKHPVKKVEAKPANTKKADAAKPTPATKAVVTPKAEFAKPAPVKKDAEAKPAPKKESVVKTKVAVATPKASATKTPAPAKNKIIKENATDTVSSKPVKPANQGNIRYSDEDLAIFKQVIDQQKSEIIEEINSLNERIEAFNNRDFTEESTYSLHMAEQTGDAIEAERARNRISDLTELVKKLNDAIIRIDNKTYGICRICNCLIAKERLLVVPVTTLSASYKLHGKCPEDGIDRTEKNK